MMVENITKSINLNKLNKNEYKYYPDHETTIKLADQVLMFNTGSYSKIIPLILALEYSIIYDTCHLENDDEHNITIVTCPITLRVTKFKGIFDFKEYDGLTMILEDKKKNLVKIDSN
jgi:hypothetical protein